MTMEQVSIHEAKDKLSSLVEKAVNGEPFIIADSGKPMVVVTAYEPPGKPCKRVGFLKGMIEVPDDFDDMGREEIGSMFEGGQ